MGINNHFTSVLFIGKFILKFGIKFKSYVHMNGQLEQYWGVWVTFLNLPHMVNQTRLI